MKKERVNLAGILIAAGFNRMRVLKILGVPTAAELTIEATAIDEHEANLVYNASGSVKVNLPGKPFNPKVPLTPNYDHVESVVVNDGTDDWSMSRSKLSITYSDGSFTSVYFGEKKSGPETDSKRPLIHRATIPPAKGWPPLKTENPQYPIAT